MENELSVTLLVDSRDRDYARDPMPTSYVLKLPETFRNVSTATLVTAELPSSFYVFTAARGNTSVCVGINGVFNTVTIPDGNYGITAMENALISALETAFSSNVLVNIDPASMLTTISTDGPTDVVAVDTTSSGNPQTQWGLAWYLGFAKGTITSGTGGVVSGSIAVLNPESYIIIDIQELNQVREAGIYGNGGTMGRCFAKVPINVDSFLYCYYDKVITSNTMNPTVAKLEALHISFRFHDGTPVDFRGVDHSLTIQLTCTSTR